MCKGKILQNFKLFQCFAISYLYTYDQYNVLQSILQDFLKENKQLITDQLIKTNFYANWNPLTKKFLLFLSNLFILFLGNQLSKSFQVDMNAHCLRQLIDKSINFKLPSGKYTIDEIKKMINTLVKKLRY